MDPTSIVIKAIIENAAAIHTSHETIGTVDDLPKAFSEVTKHLPLIETELTTAQTKLESATMVMAQSFSIYTIINHCSEDVSRLKGVFQALAEKCKQNQDSQGWATVRLLYLEVLEGKKNIRIESLMKDVLRKVEELCRHDVVLLPTDKVEKALHDLVEAGPSLEDSEFGQRTSVIATQTVNKGGFGQQNNPNGGSNTFNSGYNISGGSVNFGQAPAPV